MAVYNTIIESPNTPDSQEALKELNIKKEILDVSVDTKKRTIEIQFIKPINQFISLGFVSDNVADEIFEKYGKKANISIVDYSITFEDGLYGIEVNIDVEEEKKEESENHKKRLPLPLFILVAIISGFLTIVLILIKAFNKFKK